MRQRKPEDAWQQTVMMYANLRGWKTAHFRPGLDRSGNWKTAVSGDGKGFPDIVLVRERIVHVECKSEKGKLTREQENWRDWIIKAGGEWYCWRPSQIDEVLRTLL